MYYYIQFIFNSSEINLDANRLLLELASKEQFSLYLIWI